MNERQSELDLNRKACLWFHQWFNSRMTVLCLAIQWPRARDPKTILRIQFFLDDLERHCIGYEAGADVQDAFRYLESYFQAYPQVSLEESRTAFDMVKRIYQALGLEFEIEFHPVSIGKEGILR